MMSIYSTVVSTIILGKLEVCDVRCSNAVSDMVSSVQTSHHRGCCVADYPHLLSASGGGSGW